MQDLKKAISGMSHSQPCSTNKQLEMLVSAVDAFNKEAADFNRTHKSRSKPFKPILPYKPVGFTIPNTVAGIEELTREQKLELLVAYRCQPLLKEID